MRARGIKINVPYFEKLSASVKVKRDETLRELSSKLGHSVSIGDLSRTGFLVQAFDDEQVPYPRTLPTKKRPQGSPSFESDWMKKRDHWLPKLVVRAKKYHEFSNK